MLTIRNIATHLATLLVLAAMPCLAQSNWAVVQTFHIGGEGSWDYEVSKMREVAIFGATEARVAFYW